MITSCKLLLLSLLNTTSSFTLRLKNQFLNHFNSSNKVKIANFNAPTEIKYKDVFAHLGLTITDEQRIFDSKNNIIGRELNKKLKISDNPKNIKIKPSNKKYLVGELKIKKIEDFQAKKEFGHKNIEIITSNKWDELIDVCAMAATAPTNLNEKGFARWTFQAASNFNCLETTGLNDPANFLNKYAFDHTQGPALAIATAPATIARNYFFGYQNPKTEKLINPKNNLLKQDIYRINLLNHYPEIKLINGYINNLDILNSISIEAKNIAIGYQGPTEVVFGHQKNWLTIQTLENKKDLPKVNLVFTAAINLADISHHSQKILHSAREALRAAYAGTILAAKKMGSEVVVLNWIGGGVFCNPENVIRESMIEAIEQFLPQNMSVKIICGPDKIDQIDKIKDKFKFAKVIK